MWRLLVGSGALALGVALAAGAALGLAEELAEGPLLRASVEGTLEAVTALGFPGVLAQCFKSRRALE